MTLPSIVFGFVLALLYGSAYHFLRGGGLRRLFLFLILSLLGFTAGQMVGAAADLTFFKIGTLLAGAATAGSIVFLLVGDWLIRKT